MEPAQLVLGAETALVIVGVAWMLLGIRHRARIAGASRARHELLTPTRDLLTAAALSLGAGWAITRHEVPNLLTLVLLGVLLPATAGMALALILRQEGSPVKSLRGWFVLAVPVIGGGTAGLAPYMF
ncbi:hypothetical protein [Streptomyces sp. LS1784]|uniref:hypothetical protein n=1 Tax=Streptomyces sp. LS1784 TaxID=2851533 RepID=UPI001CCF88F3|nr:hypothetical protein [Streptomyces sp. LS1784]